MSEHPEIAEHEWYKTPYGEFRVLNRNALERGLAIVRMARNLSQDSRGMLSSKCRDSTWKVSLLTGQTAEHQTRMTESLEVNYETH